MKTWQKLYLVSLILNIIFIPLTWVSLIYNVVPVSIIGAIVLIGSIMCIFIGTLEFSDDKDVIIGSTKYRLIQVGRERYQVQSKKGWFGSWQTIQTKYSHEEAVELYDYYTYKPIVIS